MVKRPGGIFAVPTMVDSAKRASEEKARVSNLMDAVMTASGGRTRISVLMDAVMKASEADADFSEEYVSRASDAKKMEPSKKICEESFANGKRILKGRVENCKVQETQQQLTQSLCPPTFTKTVLAGSLAASHSSGIWIPLDFMNDYGHQIGNEAVLQDEHGIMWEVSVSRGSWSGFRAGWKKFADNHGMGVGDKIEFTLIAYSVFAVRIVSKSQPISHIKEFCEEPHETGYKGISRKRSARHVSSRSNKTLCGSAFEDEAESNYHQLHASIVIDTPLNPCKRARSKRCWKRFSKEIPQSETRNLRFLDNSKLNCPSARSLDGQQRELRQQDNALMYNSSAANKLRQLVEIFEEYHKTRIDVVFSQRSSHPRVG